MELFYIILVLLIFTATCGKVFGAGLAARVTGFNNHDAAAIGIAMNARGALDLVNADIALLANVFSRPFPPTSLVEHLFSAVVIMAVATTLLLPVTLRLIHRVSH